MSKCISCKKNPTQKRKLDNNGICSDCKLTVELQESATVDDDKPIAEITFGDFRKWISQELQGMIQVIVIKQMESTVKELDAVKKENEKLAKSLANAEKRLDTAVENLKKEVDKNSERTQNNKTISENNLKYLVNVDRNTRRKNVIVFGVPENDELIIEGRSTVTDKDKIQSILEYTACTGVDVIDSYRLGKPGEKPRPMKITFPTKEMAESALKESRKLKELKDLDEEINIYIKPDKTKSEQKEFQRLGKKKEELLVKYPTQDNAPPRVLLKKGILTVDGTEVDKYEPAQTLF